MVADQLIYEINTAYGRGVLDGMEVNLELPNFKVIRFRQISRAAYRDQFKRGFSDGQCLTAWGMVA